MAIEGGTFVKIGRPEIEPKNKQANLAFKFHGHLNPLFVLISVTAKQLYISNVQLLKPKRKQKKRINSKDRYSQRSRDEG